MGEQELGGPPLRQGVLFRCPLRLLLLHPENHQEAEKGMKRWRRVLGKSRRGADRIRAQGKIASKEDLHGAAVRESAGHPGAPPPRGPCARPGQSTMRAPPGNSEWGEPGT